MCWLTLLFSFALSFEKTENKFKPKLLILLAALYKLLLLNDWELSISGEGTCGLLKKLHV